MSETKQNKQIFRKILMVIFLCIFLISLGMLIDKLIIKPYNQDKTIQKAQEIYNQEDSQEEIFKRMREINPDIKGWIKIPNTRVDHPVLEPPNSDPSYYLYRNYEKNYTDYGSIFVDATYGITEDLRNTIMHGHHMNDGRMFGDILKYSDLEFYKSSPIITYNNIYGLGEWKIISIFKTNTNPSQGELFNYLRLTFANDSDFLNFVYDVKKRSLLNTPVDIKANDQLITLSTCSYEFKDFRTVIVARKVRDGESTEVDVNKASVNPNPLYPDSWYTRYKTQRPQNKTFEQALSNGEINWYVQ